MRMGFTTNTSRHSANTTHGMIPPARPDSGGGAAAASPARKKQASRPLGIISGTVFQANGRLLPGAKVVVAAIEKPKIKGEARTGRQGEFAIRVPAGGANYRVTASAKGFDRAQKTIEVYEHEKARVTFRLRPSRP